ncbi:hypothetical protein [Burkholderia mayonis]|uniref:hypothetical protein n=1 Tax=Burkholderia mayonis TaxID=1385591 RepID=UPI0009E8AD51|nr:hypothetical protein [Burkholderia mayonis]
MLKLKHRFFRRASRAASNTPNEAGHAAPNGDRQREPNAATRVRAGARSKHHAARERALDSGRGVGRRLARAKARSGRRPAARRPRDAPAAPARLHLPPPPVHLLRSAISGVP